MATLNTSMAGIGVVVEGKRQRAQGEPHESPRMAVVGASIIVAQLHDTRRFDCILDFDSAHAFHHAPIRRYLLGLVPLTRRAQLCSSGRWGVR